MIEWIFVYFYSQNKDGAIFFFVKKIKLTDSWILLRVDHTISFCCIQLWCWGFITFAHHPPNKFKVSKRLNLFLSSFKLSIVALCCLVLQLLQWESIFCCHHLSYEIYHQRSCRHVLLGLLLLQILALYLSNLVVLLSKWAKWNPSHVVYATALPIFLFSCYCSIFWGARGTNGSIFFINFLAAVFDTKRSGIIEWIKFKCNPQGKPTQIDK